MRIFIAIVSMLFGLSFSYPTFVSIMFRIGDAGPFRNLFDFFSNTDFLMNLAILVFFMFSYMAVGILILIRAKHGIFFIRMISLIYLIAEIWNWRIGHDTFIYGIIPSLIVFSFVFTTFLLKGSTEHSNPDAD